MKNKIALEEHFAIDLTIADSKVYARPEVWHGLKSNLLDFEQQRLEKMDEWGTQLSILSLNSPAVQGIPDAKRAIEVAQRANDVLAEQVKRHPTRFGGFAALPMQDPEAAARELERCVNQLGFHGFLVNGFSQVGDENTVVYYDDARFNDFWTAAAALKKPFYMHPRDPLLAREPIYDGAHWLTGPTWAFAMETAIHALRLMSSGMFDRHPALQMILGHFGEGIPFNIWRVDHILRRATAACPATRRSATTFAATCTSPPAATSARRRCSRRCSKWARTASCIRSTTRSRSTRTPLAGSTPARSARTIARRLAATMPAGSSA